jgi:RNA recognition motif-containing protein
MRPALKSFAVAGKTLYISNLPLSATEKELLLKFGRCGSVVTAKIMLDAGTGRSKRFGFVEMASGDEALTAIRRLNLTTYDGRLMSVNLARPEDVAAAKEFAPGPAGPGGTAGRAQ